MSEHLSRYSESICSADAENLSGAQNILHHCRIVSGASLIMRTCVHAHPGDHGEMATQIDRVSRRGLRRGWDGIVTVMTCDNALQYLTLASSRNATTLELFLALAPARGVDPYLQCVMKKLMMGMIMMMRMMICYLGKQIRTYHICGQRWRKHTDQYPILQRN